MLLLSISQRLMQTLRSILPVFHCCCSSNKLCLTPAMHAAGACITSSFAVSSVERAWYYCAIAGFPKALVGKAVYVLSILSQVYHTPIQVECHRDTRCRRENRNRPHFLVCFAVFLHSEPFRSKQKQKQVCTSHIRICDHS